MTTRAPRSARGEVWVFDPQQIVDEPASWWRVVNRAATATVV
jgi:hypothetical protein